MNDWVRFQTRTLIFLIAVMFRPTAGPNQPSAHCSQGAMYNVVQATDGVDKFFVSLKIRNVQAPAVLHIGYTPYDTAGEVAA
jgi:hypothetical protein